MKNATLTVALIGTLAATLALMLAMQPARAALDAEVAATHTATATVTGTPAAARVAPRYAASDLYNLANDYEKSGHHGLAVLNYQRAALLAPNDPDIAANLRFVRAHAHLPPTLPSSLERLIGNPTLIACAGILGLLLVGVAIVMLRATSAQRGVWLRRATLSAGVALITVTAINAYVLWPTLHAGVVVGTSAPARVAPVPMGEPVFTLPEAETVRIEARHEGYFLVQSRTGQTGWVAGADVAPVVPSVALY